MIDSLKVFRLVAQHASFTRAAELAGLTRPAVSQQIKQLEQHFGLELFIRNTRNVALTQAGETLLLHAERVLLAAEAMETAMGVLRHAQQTVIRVAASTLPGESLLPRALASFRNEQPGFEVHMRVANTNMVLQWVKDGQVDIGVVGQHVSDPWLVCEEVGEDEIVLALRPGESLPDPLPLSRLVELPLILREPGSATRATVVEALRQHDIDASALTIAAEVGSPEAVKSAVRAGVGCAFVSLASLSPGELRTVRVEGLVLKRPISACWPRHRELTEPQRALLANLAAQMEPLRR
ncbi:MAG: LysR substrate-binding domain-containing protein [Bacillota bacterium]